MNSIEFKKGLSKMLLDVAVFKEDETFIAYAPWLEVVGQGGNKKEALDDLMQIAKITIDWALEHNTIHDLLLELGWILKEKPKFSFRPPLFNKNSIKLKFNTEDFKTEKILAFAA